MLSEKNTSRRKKSKLLGQDVVRLVAIRNYIDAHLANDLKIVTLAKQFGMGQSTLRKHFLSFYNVPIHRHILKCRMIKAKQLICDRVASIGEISSRQPSVQVAAFFKMTISDNEGRVITITDLDAAIAQADRFKDYRHHLPKTEADRRSQAY